MQAEPQWVGGGSGALYGGGAANLSLTVGRSPLVARIAGATRRTVGFDLPLLIDAAAASYDPDDPSAAAAGSPAFVSK